MIDESLIIFRDVKDRAGIVKCLECRAASEFQEPYRAAMLLGAAEALRESIQNPIEPYLRDWRESIVATAVQALGAKEYDLAYSEGMSRSLDEVVGFCLEGRWPPIGSTGSREEPKPLIAGHPRNNHRRPDDRAAGLLYGGYNSCRQHHGRRRDLDILPCTD